MASSLASQFRSTFYLMTIFINWVVIINNIYILVKQTDWSKGFAADSIWRLVVQFTTFQIADIIVDERYRRPQWQSRRRVEQQTWLQGRHHVQQRLPTYAQRFALFPLRGRIGAVAIVARVFIIVSLQRDESVTDVFVYWIVQSNDKLRKSSETGSGLATTASTGDGKFT